MNEALSPMAEAAKKLYEFLLDHSDVFNAPYGIIDGLNPVGKGKVRGITFGICRTLDAHATIWGPNKIVVEGQGPASCDLDGEYHSVEELAAKLTELYHL